jgi:hypothetical protein
MREFITKQQAGHIKTKHETERNNIRAKANKENRNLTGAEKKRINEIKRIIADCDAVIRGDGRKKGK